MHNAFPLSLRICPFSKIPRPSASVRASFSLIPDPSLPPTRAYNVLYSICDLYHSFVFPISSARNVLLAFARGFNEDSKSFSSKLATAYVHSFIHQPSFRTIFFSSEKSQRDEGRASIALCLGHAAAEGRPALARVRPRPSGGDGAAQQEDERGEREWWA